MADDDPYNFEIEIPGNSKKAAPSSRYRDASDDDDGDDNDGGSDVTPSPSPQKPLQGGKKPPPAKQAAAAAKSNALDKAKNFLSKYSTKQATPKARARVQLSDDEDDDSDAATRRKTPAKAPKKPPVEDSMDDMSDVESKHAPHDESVGDISGLSEFDESSDKPTKSTPSFQPTPVPIVAQKEPTPVAAPAQAPSYQRPSDSDDDDDTPARPITQQTTAPTPKAAVAKAIPPMVKNAAPVIQDDDYSDIEDEVESIGDVSKPIATEPAPAVTLPPGSNTAPKPVQTQSFNYSMDFSDDDTDKTVGPAVLATQSPSQPSKAASDNEDEYMDESFVESQSPTKPTAVSPPTVVLAPSLPPLTSPPAVRSLNEDEYLDESFDDRSPAKLYPSVAPATFEENASSDFDDDDTPDDAPVEAPAPSPGVASSKDTDRSDKSPAVVALPLHDAHQTKASSLPLESAAPSREAAPTPPPTVSDSRVLPDDPAAHAPRMEPRHASSPPSIGTPQPETPARRRVVIVREYELSPRGQVEMKDAATQFTGNHVLIQADLNPHRTTNEALSRETRPSTPILPEHSMPPREACHAPPPPPPMDAMMGGAQPDASFIDASMASVNTTLSTSMYRQQLQHIQAQIRRKRLESERVMREAMAYRYTSMDAAEKFVALNRPRKLALWEALMQVDPLMSKDQAMKIEAMSKSA